MKKIERKKIGRYTHVPIPTLFMESISEKLSKWGQESKTDFPRGKQLTDFEETLHRLKKNVPTNFTIFTIRALHHYYNYWSNTIRKVEEFIEEERGKI